MSAITISREIGSQGDEIAAQVALALGHHLVDRRFIGSILSQYGLVEFDQEYQTLPGFWQRFDAQREQRRDQMVAMLNQVIQAVARHGNVVIVGRSGYVVLAGFADVLHVRLQAPQAVRIARVAVSQGLSAAQAEDAVQTSDLVRATFVEDFYDVSRGFLRRLLGGHPRLRFDHQHGPDRAAAGRGLDLRCRPGSQARARARPTDPGHSERRSCVRCRGR